MPDHFVLAVTTFNRLERLKRLLDSFLKTRDPAFNWQIVVADDGSDDGTLEYLRGLRDQTSNLTLITNDRQGIHHQFNTIVHHIKDWQFTLCFKCDDDIEFIKPGWDILYRQAVKESGYDHLVHFDPHWRPKKNLSAPVEKKGLKGACALKDVQGAFFTLTPRMITRIGYMDTLSFGFRGVGHVDYTARACRAGFNDGNHPFDVIGSETYIRQQQGTYSSALNQHIQHALENDEETRRKYQLVNDETRLYIPFLMDAPTLTPEKEYHLLLKRLEILQEEKIWYEKTYGHQPRWFVRLGKILKKLGVF